MKYIFILLMLWLKIGYADPFYKEEKNNTEDIFVENSEEVSACMPQSNLETYILETPFEQLKFIGVVEISNKTKALFMDNEQQIIDLKKDLFVLPSMIEIKQIDLKSVQYIDWKNTKDCLNPVSVTKKL